MSSFKYCPRCEHGMDQPSLTETVLLGTQECGHCGHEWILSYGEKEFVVKDFQDRLERMEKFLAQWMPKS